MPQSPAKLDSPRRLAELLQPGEPWPPAQALQLVHGLALQVGVLHQQRETHRAITPEEVVVDEQLRPKLSAPPGPRRFGGGDYDPQMCPPELAEGDAVELPAALEAGQTVLRKAGCPLDPRRIDVYQLAALLCRLVTGETVRAYMFSPAAKAKVPEPVRPLLDRALGHDGGKPLADCGAWAEALAEALEGAGAAPEAVARRDTPAYGSQIGRVPDTPARGSLPAPPPDAVPPAGAELPFRRLGGYEILARVGRGGMGDVYKGYEASLDRYVAIKVLPAELARDEEFVHRFHDEATAAAKVAHPNVVPIYAIGEEAGHHFFAMQFIEGESLSSRLRREHHLATDEALGIVEQCLAGLEAAHAAGLIHRDVKPGNVLLERGSGRAVVVDFGLARRADKSTQMTATGVVMGTVDYIAPEQARGRKVDARADLYSLGVLLYQLLAGRLPFEADTPTAMIFQHAYEPPLPLAKAAPGVAAPLAAIVDKLLRKDPSERYPSARAVLDDLAAFRQGRPVAAEHAEAAREPAVPTAAFPAADGAAPWLGSEGVGEEKPLGRLRDWAATIFRRHAPQFVKDLQTTTQQIDGAVAQYERRHRRLARLLEEGRNIAAALSEQLQANRQAAAEAEQAAESAPTEEARDAADRKREAGEDAAAALQSQLDAQQEETDRIELELDKVNATLARLRSQRDLLAARLAAAEAQQSAESDVPRSARRRRILVAAACACSLLLVALTAFLLPRLMPRGVIPRGVTPGDSAPALAVAPFDGVQARDHQERWAKYLHVPVVGANSIGMKFVLIPPGEFLMGSTPEEIAWATEQGRKVNESYLGIYAMEGPRHQVRISRPSYLGMFEVTQSEYQQLMGTNPSSFSAGGADASKVRGDDTARYPVEMISRDDAWEFCRRLSALPAERSAGRTYRLPTEAEWEYACRAGTTTKWSFGDDPSALGRYAWFAGNGGGTTHPVGQKKPNAWGLYDMLGNVAEWVSDWHKGDYYRVSPRLDPAGPATSDSGEVRGGSFQDAPCRCRSAFRPWSRAWTHFHEGGFRVAMTLTPGSVPLRPAASPQATVVGAPQQPVVVWQWNPQSVSVQRQVVAIDVSKWITRPGTYALRWQYTNGVHRLDIDGVALMRSGRPICRDEHFGFTGGVTLKNTYTLKVDDVSRREKFLIEASIHGDDGNDSYGTVWLQWLGD